jgi:hypothetical protein
LCERVCLEEIYRAICQMKAEVGKVLFEREPLTRPQGGWVDHVGQPSVEIQDAPLLVRELHAAVLYDRFRP